MVTAFVVQLQNKAFQTQWFPSCSFPKEIALKDRGRQLVHNWAFSNVFKLLKLCFREGFLNEPMSRVQIITTRRFQKGCFLPEELPSCIMITPIWGDQKLSCINTLPLKGHQRLIRHSAVQCWTSPTGVVQNVGGKDDGNGVCTAGPRGSSLLGGWEMVRQWRDGRVHCFDWWGDSLKLAGPDEYSEPYSQLEYWFSVSGFAAMTSIGLVQLSNLIR